MEEEIIKAIEIAKEIQRVAASDDTSKTSHLFEYVANYTYNAEELIEQLTDKERVKFMTQKMDSMKKEQEITRLIHSIEIRRRKRNRKIIATTVTSVAALLVVSFVIFYSYFKSTVTEEKILSAPRSSVPLLITNKGETINLDEVVGEVVASDYHILKKDNNSISMTKIGKSKSSAQIQYNELIIPSKYQYRVELSDGTIVTLNAGTTFNYPTEFEGEERGVELHGEGYFEVTKTDKPFVVTVNGLKVKVYGTKFNIKTRSNGDVETFLVEGSVGLYSDLMQEVRLSPNELAIYDTKKASATLQEGSAYDQTLWRENYFKYSEETIKNVLNDLSAWYGIDFNIRGDMSDIKLTFFISRDLSHNYIFNFIETLTDVKFIWEGGNNYTISQ